MYIYIYVYIYIHVYTCIILNPKLQTLNPHPQPRALQVYRPARHVGAGITP